MNTIKTISTYYALGYSVAAHTDLYITSSGGVGGDGVNAAYNAAVTNYGRVASAKPLSAGVAFGAGGVLVNGSAAYDYALVQGHAFGVEMEAAGSVSNFGTIRAVGSIYQQGEGILLAAGGRLTNGSNRDTGAMVEGYVAVVMGGAGSVVNYGTIDGLGAGRFDDGIDLAAGGSVVNGFATARAALIEGGGGVYVGGAAGTIRNSGTILSTGDGFAVALAAGGTLANGSPNNSQALIQGYSGIYMAGGAATNLGLVSALGDIGAGASLAAGASLTNGDAQHSAARIEGGLGVYGAFSAPGLTVTNFGVIAGAAGTALVFESSGDLLNVEASCAFIGVVSGGGGSVEFANGTGTLSNLGGGAVTASGSMATTTFEDFDAVIVGAGANFVDKSAVTLAAGQYVSCFGDLALGGKGKASIVNAGELSVGGLAGALTLNSAVVNTGTLASFGGAMTLAAAVTGNGVAELSGISTIDFVAGFSQNVTFEAASFATLELGQSQTYTGTITGFSTAGDSMLDLADIGFIGAGEATFSGTSKGGVLTVSDGTHTAEINLKGSYLSSAFVCASDGHGGVIIHDPRAPVPAIAGAFVAAMAAVGGEMAGADRFSAGGGAAAAAFTDSRAPRLVASVERRAREA